MACTAPSLNSYNVTFPGSTGDTTYDPILQEEKTKMDDLLQNEVKNSEPSDDANFNQKQADAVSKIFKTLVDDAKTYLEEERNKTRITGNEYTKYLIELMMAAMQQSTNALAQMNSLKLNAKKTALDNAVSYAQATKLLEERTLIARQEHEAEKKGNIDESLAKYQILKTGADIESTKKEIELTCSKTDLTDSEKRLTDEKKTVAQKQENLYDKQADLYVRQKQGYDDQYNIDKTKQLANIYAVYATNVATQPQDVALNSMNAANSNKKLDTLLQDIINNTDY